MRPVRRRVRGKQVDPRWALPLAGLLFAVAFSLGVTSDHADAPLVLFVVPIALLAVTYGLYGGIASAGVAIALSTGALGPLTDQEDVGPLGYFSRSTAYVVVGVLVGRYADQRRALLAALARQHEMSHDAMATVRFDGFFEKVNPAWTRILGYSEEELLARPLVELLHPDDVEQTLAASRRLAENGGSALDFRNRFRTKDGSYRWLEWTVATDRAAQRFYGIARDITEKKHAEEALERYQELLEETVRERTRDLEAARLETLQRLAYAAEYRDYDTHEHTERVGRAASLIAARLGLPENQVDLIRQAAPLHDVGKLGIPDSVLLKPGKLDRREHDVMKNHARVGARMLAGSTSPALKLAEEIAASHHEWWDGSGYPHGLKGDAIPVSGRIVALADVFDALTHARPYKPAWPVARAVAEIRRLAGRQFDPDVVAAFEQLEPARLLGPVDALAAAV